MKRNTTGWQTDTLRSLSNVSEYPVDLEYIPNPEYRPTWASNILLTRTSIYYRVARQCSLVRRLKVKWRNEKISSSNICSRRHDDSSDSLPITSWSPSRWYPLPTARLIHQTQATSPRLDYLFPNIKSQCCHAKSSCFLSLPAAFLHGVTASDRLMKTPVEEPYNLIWNVLF